MTKKKNSKNLKPQVPEKKIIENNNGKKKGNKQKILSLAILVWSAIIYGLYIPAVSWSLGGSREILIRLHFLFSAMLTWALEFNGLSLRSIRSCKIILD